LDYLLVPQDACPEIKRDFRIYFTQKLRQGAVRDVIEQVMKVQGKWMESFNGKLDQLSHFSKF
jgi:3-deoxy-D-manno-octulosonate 8-phosphate phosphatase (KDO 8-P phosphatase)